MRKFSLYVRAFGMTEKESNRAVRALQDAGCSVLKIRYGWPRQDDYDKVNLLDSKRVEALRVLGSHGGIIVIEGHGVPILENTLPMPDSGFLL